MNFRLLFSKMYGYQASHVIRKVLFQLAIVCGMASVLAKRGRDGNQDGVFNTPLISSLSI